MAEINLNIDLELLKKQKEWAVRTLHTLEKQKLSSHKAKTSVDSLQGIINLLDEVQDQLEVVTENAKEKIPHHYDTMYWCETCGAKDGACDESSMCHHCGADDWKEH